MARGETVTPEQAARESAAFWAEVNPACAWVASRAALEASRVCLELDGASHPKKGVVAVAELTARRFPEGDPVQVWIPAAAVDACYGVDGRVVDNGYLAERSRLLTEAATMLSQLELAREGEQ